MIVDFEEKGHIYSVNGEIASISVTELLTKHGLSPYSGVNKAKMKESADVGKEIHKDLEDILNVAGYEPKTEQGKQFAEWVKENLDCGVGEQMLGFESNGLVIAGTADVMAIAKDKTLIIADHKNTSQFHREYVSWQVSILDYFARKLGKEKINGKLLNWKGAKRFICFHYDPKTGKMTAHELNKVADEEIERLIEYVSHEQLAKYDNSITEVPDDYMAGADSPKEEYDDPMYNEVVDFAIQTGKISASLIQRRFRFGYNRAARIIDLLEERGIIGGPNGSKPREVLVKLDNKSEE